MRKKNYKFLNNTLVNIKNTFSVLQTAFFFIHFILQQTFRTHSDYNKHCEREQKFFLI